MDMQITIQEIVNYKPQTASVEGKALVESQHKAGHWHVSHVVSLYDLGWCAFLCNHETDHQFQFHHRAGFLLCWQHHHHNLSRKLFTNNAYIWSSRGTTASHQKSTSLLL